MPLTECCIRVHLGGREPLYRVSFYITPAYSRVSHEGVTVSLRDQIIPYNEPIFSNSKESILARLFRGIRDEIGIPENKFNMLVDRYTLNAFPDLDPKKTSSTRGNIRKDYLKSHMTWNVFTRAFEILNAKSFTFSINASFLHEGIREAGISRRVVIDPKHKTSDKDLLINEEALRVLYEDLQMETGLTTQKFNELFKIYAQRTHLPSNMKALSSARGNLSKELRKNMSWKVFVKALVFLTACQVDIGVQMTRFDNVTFSSYLRVVLDPSILDEKDEDESE